MSTNRTPRGEHDPESDNLASAFDQLVDISFVNGTHVELRTTAHSARSVSARLGSYQANQFAAELRELADRIGQVPFDG